MGEMLEKNDVISEDYFKQQIFQKPLKFNFSIVFIKDFQIFLKISPQFVFFVQTREKLTHGF